MSGRDDSDSKRRGSRFDPPQPSPKRYRKDAKQEIITSSNVQNGGQRKAAERGWWKDARNHHNEKEEINQGRDQHSDEKSQTKPDDNTSHTSGGFSERKVDQPPTSRKKPAFREKNIPVDSENVNLTATEVTVKSSQFDHPAERKERKEEKSSHPYHFDRPEKQFANDRANKDKTGRGFPSRERHRSNGGNANSKGRDKFNGRQC